jgi:hypothetical protein
MLLLLDDQPEAFFLQHILHGFTPGAVVLCRNGSEIAILMAKVLTANLGGGSGHV